MNDYCSNPLSFKEFVHSNCSLIKLSKEGHPNNFKVCWDDELSGIICNFQLSLLLTSSKYDTINGWYAR